MKFDKIYFDLDGVMANFEKALALILRKHYWDRDSDEFWKKLETVDNFFYNLDVMPDALPLFDAVVERVGIDNVEILTAIPEPTGKLVTADFDKRAWVADIVHPTVKVNTCIGGKNKVKWLETNPSALLIDDYARNIDLWIKGGGVGIIHTDAHSTYAKLQVLGVL